MTSLCVSTHAIHAQLVPMEFAQLRFFLPSNELERKEVTNVQILRFHQKNGIYDYEIQAIFFCLVTKCPHATD